MNPSRSDVAFAFAPVWTNSYCVNVFCVVVAPGRSTVGAAGARPGGPGGRVPPDQGSVRPALDARRPPAPDQPRPLALRILRQELLGRGELLNVTSCNGMARLCNIMWCLTVVVCSTLWRHISLAVLRSKICFTEPLVCTFNCLIRLLVCS